MAAEAVAANLPINTWSTFEQTAKADLFQWVPKNADADFHVWKVQQAMDLVRKMLESGVTRPSFISTAYGSTEPQRYDPTGIAHLIKKIVNDVYTFDASIAQYPELIAGAARWDRMPLLSPMQMEVANAQIATPEAHVSILPFAIGSYAHQPETPVVYDVRSQNSLCFIGNRQDRVNAMKRVVQSARYMNPTESLQLITMQDLTTLDEVNDSFMGHDLTFLPDDFPFVMDVVDASGKQSNGKTHIIFIADSLEKCIAQTDYRIAFQSLARLSQLQEEGVSITWMLGMNHELYSNMQKTAVSVLFPYSGQTHIFRGIGDHTPRDVATHSDSLKRDLQEIPAGAYIQEPHYSKGLHNVDMIWPLGGGEA